MARKPAASAPSSGGAEDNGPRTLTVTLPSGRVVRPEEEMPFGVIVEVAEKNACTWAQVVSSALFVGSGQVAEDLYRATCKFAKEKPPAMITARLLWDAFGSAPSSEASTFVEGLPPTGDQRTA